MIFNQKKLTVLVGKPNEISKFCDKGKIKKNTHLVFLPEFDAHYTEFKDKAKKIAESKSTILIITQSKEFVQNLVRFAEDTTFVLYCVLDPNNLLKYDKQMIIYALEQNIEFRGK